MAPVRPRIAAARSRVARLGAQLLALAERAGNEPPVASQGAPSAYHGPRRVAPSGTATGLTPARIKSILEEANDGDLVRFAELLEEIEDRDPHIVGVLGTRKRAVANLAWSIEPAGGRQIDRKVAELCESRLRQIDNFEDGLLDLLDAISKGVAFVELDWIEVPDGYAIRRMQYRPQRWFRTDPDDPELFRLLSMAEPVHGEPLWRYRWAVHVSRAKSGFPTQSGLGRVLCWWWLFKSYAIKDWVSYSELFGAPMRVGKYDAGSKPDDIDDLHDALISLGVDAVATIPRDMEVEFVQAQGQGGPDVYERLATFVNREVSKATLGQTLTTEEGQNGARALGQVHDEVRQDIIESDAKQLARTLKRDLLTPLVEYHFGGAVPVPTLVFDTEPPTDTKAEAEAQEIRGKVFAQARQLGLEVPVAQVQEELGIRPRTRGEAVLPPLPQIPSPAEPESATQAPASDTTTLPGHPSPCPVCTGRGRGTRHVALADRADLPPQLRQVEQAAEAYINARSNQAWSSLVDSFQEALLQGGPSVGQVPDRFVAIVERLTATHPELAALADELSNATLTAELVGRAQVVAGDQVLEGLPQVPPTEAANWWQTKAAMDPDAFYALAGAHRARAFTISGWTCLDALRTAQGVLEGVIRDGGTLAEFEDALTGIRGGTSLGPARLLNVFRTNISTAYSVGRDREQRRPETLARRPWWKYNAVDDSRTRREHADVDTLVFPYDHEFWDVWTPPNGYQCRCWRTAHSEDEVRAMGLKVQSELPRDPLTNLAYLPDSGFRTDPARDGELDWLSWDRFPAEWVAALDTEVRGEA